jgi:thioredoxin-dependent peroxiredoxin
MMSAPREGAIAPDFDLPTNDGGRVALSALRGRPVVLYFYPQDNTETCTIQAIDFSAALKDFEAAGATIIGVSPDSVKSHERFRTKHGLGITLAADPDRKAINRYGLWIEKSMFGRTFMGVERATFLIDAEGRINRMWRKVRIKGHVQEVLAAVRELNNSRA